MKGKHKALLIRIFSLGAAVACVTPATGTEVLGGVWASANVATVIFDADIGISYQAWTRPAGGIEFEIPVKGRFSLAAQMGWAPGGASATLDFPGLEARVRTRLERWQTLNVARLSLGRGTVRPYLAGGVAAAWLQSARLETSAAGRREVEDITADLKRYEYGVALGAGLWVPLGKGRLRLEAMLIQGLTDLDAVGDAPLRTQDVRVTAGWTLPLGAK